LEPQTIFDSGDEAFVPIALEATSRGKRDSFPDNGDLWQLDAAGQGVQDDPVADTARLIWMARAD